MTNLTERKAGMAKGKYAARAATARAENAADKAARLEAQLASERAAHTAETTDLKNQIQQLQGQLTRGMNDLAGGAVAAAHRDARELVEAERARFHAKALEACKFLLSPGPDTGPRINHEDAMHVHELLGVDPGDAIVAYGMSRVARRMTGPKLRAAAERFEQGHTPALNMPKKRV